MNILDVAHRTRIPANRIQQLEEDNYAAFGSMAYAKSFLKTYSRFLEVDSSEVLEGLPSPVLGGPDDYRYLTEVQGPWVEKRSRPQRRELLTRAGRSPVPTLALMFALFVVVGGIFGSHLVERQKGGDPKSSDAAAVDAKTSTEKPGLKKDAATSIDPKSPSLALAAETSFASNVMGQKPTGGEEVRTVVRPAVLPSAIPAPDTPNTPVRKPQIVEDR